MGVRRQARLDWQKIRHENPYNPLLNTGSKSLLLILIPRNKMYRSTAEPKRFPQLIFKVSLIREMQQIFVIYKKHECRWANRDLGHVIDAKRSPFIRRRLIH